MRKYERMTHCTTANSLPKARTSVGSATFSPVAITVAAKSPRPTVISTAHLRAGDGASKGVTAFT